MNFIPPYGNGTPQAFDDLGSNQGMYNQGMNNQPMMGLGMGAPYGYGQMGCGCNQGCGCPNACPTMENCNQVVQTCNIQDVPHYINYHTHVVNNCVKRHFNVPSYSGSSEVRIINQYEPPLVGQNYQSGTPFGNNQAGNPGLNNFFVPFIL